jgi:hypothetical protein
MKRVLVRAIAATALGAAAVGGVSVAAFGTADSAQACGFSVTPPDSNSLEVWVSGFRRGCTDTVRMTLELRKSGVLDRPVATATRTGVNFDLTARGRCAQAGPGEYYGVLKTDARTLQGPKQLEC